MKKIMDELAQAATVIALRKGIVKASLLLVKAKSQSESHQLVSFIQKAAFYIDKLKSAQVSEVSDLKMGLLIKNRKFVRELGNKTGIATVHDLMRLPIHSFHLTGSRKPSGTEANSPENVKEEINKSLYEVISAMHPGALGKNKR